MKQVLRCVLAALCVMLSPLSTADDPVVDPMAILGAAKAASGGSTWNDLKALHSRVTLTTGGLTGPVERWSEYSTGRSYLTYALGPTSGAAGFDGTSGWTQDASGESRSESARTPRELAVNAAYRDQLAFWFPQRHAAKIVFKGHERRDDAEFDIISVTPDGGREFDLWINADTHLIERLTEQEASVTRTEFYMDFRDVAGLRIPFRVRATRGDPRYDEIITIDAIDFAPPQVAVNFAKPAPPAPDYAFPAGKQSVEVPFTLRNGHVYVEVKLNGNGPYLMLFDSGGANVLFPETASALGLKTEGAIEGNGVGEAKQDAALTRVDALEIGGISVANQVFVSLPLGPQIRRIEGVDRVAGLVGYELFKRFPTRIDYTRNRIVFYNPAQWRYGGDGVKLPIHFKDNIAQVNGSLDGIDGMFDIDTGSRTSLTVAAPFAREHNLAEKYHATGEIITGAGVGGPSRTRIARAGMLKLGSIEVQKPVTLLSTATAGAFADSSLAGNVGYGILRRFNLVFDYRNEVIWFEKNAAYNEPDVHDRAGIWVERADKGFTVADVLAGGPAAAAGLKMGDVVRAVDGKPATGIALDTMRNRFKAAAGSTVRLTLTSGKTVEIKLKDLV